MATPDGKLSRYFFGIDYAPRDVKFALIESSAGKIGIAGRSAAALLLSLRSDDRAVRLCGDARGADRRRGDAAGAGRIHVRLDSARAPRVRTLAYVLYSAFRSFPSRHRRSPQTSTRSTSSSSRSARSLRSRVTVAVIVLRHPVSTRPHEGQVGARIEGNLPLELLWSVIPTMLAMVMFGWGASVVLPHAPSARRGHAHLRRRQAVDVEVPAPRRAARDQRAARARRPADQGHDHAPRTSSTACTSRRSAPRSTRFPGRYTELWFEASKAGHVPHLLRRVLRHEPLGDDRQCRGDGADAPIRRGWRAAAMEGTLAQRGGRAVPAIWPATPAISTPARAAGRRSRTSSARPWSCRTASTTVVDEGYLRESILNSQAKIVKGFQPLMPTFQGLVSEDEPGGARRVREVAVAERDHGPPAAPRRRRRRPRTAPAAGEKK